AEDGIRDGHVTGVQTCALPISGGGQRQLRAARRAAGGRAARVGAMIRRLLPWLMLAVSGGMIACAEWAGSELRGPQLSIVPLIRSEERRVGKACRSRRGRRQRR